ncbi:MAG TPA: hypothetical protein VFG04_28670 [Planctomycetaceae bacterium]|jgi:hypothetical protein|nr:hypothetical protein [Planctomycetaceae bacterium]
MMSFRTRQRGSHKVPALLAALLMLSAPGCASLTLLNLKSEKVPTADAEHPAIEILAIWQAAEGPGPQGIPVRGFAGQIYFFSQDRAQPVAVDGTARIYVFDDHGTVEEQVRPLRQFDFDRASWTAHLQTSKLGPTYGVFIPYPRNDYHQAVCSLRVRFTAPKCRPLYSLSSTIALPGPPLNPETATPTVQTSALDSLAKKLQSQRSPAARQWPSASVAGGAGSLNANPQLPPGQAQVGQPQVGQAQVGAPQYPGVIPVQQAALNDWYSRNRASTVPGAAAQTNPILQTSDTIEAPSNAPPGAFPDAMAASANAVGYSGSTSQGVVQPSGRFSLQAATPAVTHAYWSSDAPATDSANDAVNNQQAAAFQAAQPVAHPNHPLAD